MTRKPPSNVQEIIDLAVRRKWWIIASVLIVPPLVFVVGWYLPKQYRSETMIMVDQQRVPAEYVKATVTGDVTDRLQTISEEVMSRTRLLTIANKDNLYGKTREKYGDDVALAAMRKDITVDIIKGANDRSPIDGFKIAYIATTPKMAQRVTQQIADLFIQENVKEQARTRRARNNSSETHWSRREPILRPRMRKFATLKPRISAPFPSRRALTLR